MKSVNDCGHRRGNSDSIEKYYRIHSKIYDMTRWSFLFGRSELIKCIPSDPEPYRILEVGCGTGKNILSLSSRFPKAEISGLDCSEQMLKIASRKTLDVRLRVRFLMQTYDKPLGSEPAFDLILFSYSLSMFNPGWEEALSSAYADLKPSGHIAVVDFHRSKFNLFQKWMGVNHVRMESHILPRLIKMTDTHENRIMSAYGGVWEYMIFIGKKKQK